LTYFEIGTRFGMKARGNHRLNSSNLRILNRNRNATSSDYCDHSRGHENWQAVKGIKLAEHISREKRGIHLFRLALPLFHGLESWKKSLISLT
jgi:hypothetical protein